VRYVNKEGIQEKFIGFKEAKELNATGLCKLLMTSLKDVGLLLMFLFIYFFFMFHTYLY